MLQCHQIHKEKYFHQSLHLQNQQTTMIIYKIRIAFFHQYLLEDKTLVRFAQMMKDSLKKIKKIIQIQYLLLKLGELHNFILKKKQINSNNKKLKRNLLKVKYYFTKIYLKHQGFQMVLIHQLTSEREQGCLLYVYSQVSLKDYQIITCIGR